MIIIIIILIVKYIPKQKTWVYYIICNFKPFTIYMIPITPQAARPPAFPVFFESGWFDRPKSSAPLCTTTARPIILLGPDKFMTWSENLVSANPCSSALIFPRSPMCRTWSFGAPCSSLKKLKKILISELFLVHFVFFYFIYIETS